MKFLNVVLTLVKAAYLHIYISKQLLWIPFNTASLSSVYFKLCSCTFNKLSRGFHVAFFCNGREVKEDR